MKRRRLHPEMTLKEFDNGYWFALEVKAFAKRIGIPSANKLRKDELEVAVRTFLRTGRAANPVKRALSIEGPKDAERGLRPGLPVVRYNNDPETKAFLEREMKKMAPGVKRKSGSRYRLNRWREEQLTKGRRITYRDLVKEYVRLNRTEGRFEQVPVGRYINFLSDFLRKEKGATHARARAAWKKLKKMDAPKNYRGWKRASSRSR